MRNDETMKQLDTVFLDYVRRVTLIGGGASDVNLMNYVRQLPARIDERRYRWHTFGSIMHNIITITRRKIGTEEDDGTKNHTWEMSERNYTNMVKQLNGLIEEIERSDPMMCLKALMYDWEHIYGINRWDKTGLFSLPPKIKYDPQQDVIDRVNNMLNDLVDTVLTCDRVNQNFIPVRYGKSRWIALQQTWEAMGIDDAAFVDLKKDMRAAMRDTKLGSKSARTRAARQILVDRAISQITPRLDPGTTQGSDPRPRTFGSW